MKRSLCIGTVIILSLVGGCGPTQTASTQPTIVAGGPDEIASLRMQFENQGMVFGRVVAVYAPTNRAAVGEIPTNLFKEGDVVSFIDLKGNTIAFGRVVKVEPDILHVIYDASAPGHRVPTENDFAVSLKEGASSPTTVPAPATSPAAL